MKKTLQAHVGPLAALTVVAAALLLPLVASATCTFTGDETTSVATCTTGTETIPTLATEGLPVLNCFRGLSVFIAADATRTLSGTGTLKVYMYDAGAAAWGEAPDLAMSATVSGARYHAFPGLFFTASRISGRIAVLPSGVGVSAGGVTVYLRCQ
jgi:hypothetical protein